jgi:putative FmdB family regulatory protein
MPTYQYRCPSCGHEFEKFEKITAKTRRKCPQCATRAERVISGGAGLLFKGSGFYITDYKRSGEPKEAESKPGESSVGSEKKKEAGGEQTPEAPKKSPKSQGSE